MRVDFYILTSTETKQRWFMACRLLEKAYNKNHTVYVHCNNPTEAKHLDGLLWTFKEDSFIPHGFQQDEYGSELAIQIGYQQHSAPLYYEDILLNMAEAIPSYCSRFKRIIEIISADEQQKTIGRQHYQYYHLNQWDILIHKI